MSLRLRELIKKVRTCKTAEEERSVINKESAEIRNMGKVFINNKNIIQYFIGTFRSIKKQKPRKMCFHAYARLPYQFYPNDLR